MASWEYLLFNATVICMPLLLSFFPRMYFLDRWKYAWLSVTVVAIPYIIWDSLVTGHHWHFNPLYTLSYRFGGLPLGEILFFFTVPFACLFTWEILIDPKRGVSRPMLKWLYPFLWALLPLGIVVFTTGKQYTGLMLSSIGLAAIADKLSGTKLLLQPRFHLYTALTTVFTLIFNYYLTSRPVVQYGTQYQLDFRILTIPIEDFGYGMALLYFCTIVYEKLQRREIPVVAHSLTMTPVTT